MRRTRSTAVPLTDSVGGTANVIDEGARRRLQTHEHRSDTPSPLDVFKKRVHDQHDIVATLYATVQVDLLHNSLARHVISSGLSEYPC